MLPQLARVSRGSNNADLHSKVHLASAFEERFPSWGSVSEGRKNWVRSTISLTRLQIGGGGIRLGTFHQVLRLQPKRSRK